MHTPAFNLSLEVLLFGVLKDIAHSNSVTVSLPVEVKELSVSQLLELLAQQYPALERYLPHVRVAVNCEYVNSEYSVRRGDEVALLPPVAGGCIAL